MICFRLNVKGMRDQYLSKMRFIFSRSFFDTWRLLRSNILKKSKLIPLVAGAAAASCAIFLTSMPTCGAFAVMITSCNLLNLGTR